VEGYIHEETVIDTRPLEGALVSITGSPNTAITDTDGYFRIDEVSIGARTLTITKESYITYKILSVVIRKDEVTLIDDGDPIAVRAVDDKYLFDGGVIYYDSSEYTNALTTFQQLIDDFPDSQYAASAQYYIAYINEKKLGYYIQIDDSPESSLLALAQYSIGQSYRKLDNYTQAIIEFTKVIENYPESDYPAPAQYYIGYSHYQAQDYNQAILEFQKIIDYYPNSTWPGEPDRLIAPCAQYYIGWCYGQKLEQWNDAITAFQLIIDNYPNGTWSNGSEIPPDAQYQIGWCYERLEQWSDAIIAYQKVIDNYPNSTWSGGVSIPADAQARIDWINDNHPPS
jgi:TolA-binding protein